MACTIKYNKKGKIETVLTPQGKESQLFKQIAKLPHVNNLEEALDVFKNSYSEKINNTLVEESNLTFKSDKGNQYLSFKEALLDSSGGDIEVGLDNNTVLFISSNTDPKTVSGFINSNIKGNILSDERIIDQGESFLKAEGFDDLRQLAGEAVLKEDAIVNLGGGSIKVHKDGRIELKEKVTVVEGKQINTAQPFPKLKEVVSEAAAVSTSVQNALRDALNNKVKTEAVVSEDTLKLKLLSLLNKMGVKVTSISDYVASYKIRNGVEPSAEALADIANEVIAFKDGKISTELLSEEASHFIVEAWDVAEIENLIRNAHKTESYAEFSEEYREIYSRENPNLTEDEIENLVRKEILGKELAKALQARFNAENKTDIQKSIWQKLYDNLIKFFQRLTTTEQFYADLEVLTTKVEDLLISEEVGEYLNTGQFKTKTFKMYSTKSGNVEIDALRDLAKNSVSFLLEQEKSLRRAKKGSQSNVTQLKEIDKKLGDLTVQMDEALLAKSITDILALARRQTEYINSAIEASNKKGETLSNEESFVLYNLQNQTVPALSRMRDKIEKYNSPLFNKLDSVLTDVSARILKVKGKLENTENSILERVLDRVMQRHQLPEKIYNADGTVKRDVRAELMESLKSAKKDTNMLFAMYGQITHARDPLLNMLGSVIGDLFTQAEQTHLNRAKTLQDFLRKNGFKESDAKEFIKGKYLLSLYDFDKYEKAEQSIRIEELLSISPDKTLTAEGLKDKKIFAEELRKLTSEEASKYGQNVAKRIKKEKENPFDDKYYEEREKELAPYSEYTKAELRKLSLERGELVNRASVENGRIRYSYGDRTTLDALNLKRKRMKSLTNEVGELKQGIVLDSNGAVEVQGLRYNLLPSASDEAILAYEMHQIDKNFFESKGITATEGIADSFEQELASITDEAEAKEFFLMNTLIGFSDNFWDSFDDSQTFIQRAEELVASKPELQDALDSYKEKVAQRNNILKQYKDNRDTTNILANEMPQDVKQAILDLSDDIDEKARLFTDLRASESEIEAESTPNQAYFGALRDNNLQTPREKLDFAMRNMTPANQRKVREFNDALDDHNKGKILSKRQESLIERILGLKPYELETSEIENYKLENAEKKLAAYYRAFAPKGLSELMQDLENGQKTAYEVMTALKNNPNVKMTNHYSYYEKTEVKDRNKNKIEGFIGGHAQPKLYDENGQEKYVNKDFVRMFNPKKENGRIVVDENGDIIPTTNQKKYEYYKALINYHTESLKSYSELGDHNAYLAPQVSKQDFETVSDLVSKKNKGAAVKEWWRDISKFRADELATGAEANGQSLFKGLGVKVIPKYYLNQLEDEASVSQDLFYTMTAFAQQAELYKARVEKFHEVAVLQDTLTRRKYPDGKATDATSTYKIFQNYVNGSIFGIREMREFRANLPFIGEVNLTKAIDFLHKFLKHRALSVNLIIPATSWITAEGTLFLEKIIGQYIDSDSYSRSRRELRKLTGSSFKDALEIDSSSKMGIIGEHFGVFDLDAKFKNSAFSKGTRLFARAPYILHTAANFTPISKAVLSNLYGHRIYNGRFVDFAQYKNISKSKTAKADWKSLESKSLYNYIVIDKNTNTMTYDYNTLAKDMGVPNDEAFKENFRNQELGITAKTKKLVELIDGQIRPEEKTFLQRDILGRFMMTHFSWAAIGASRRFKGRHYSFQTGLEEEGTYVSFANYMVRAFNGMTKEGFKSFKKAYLEADETEQSNLKRMMKEVAFLQAVAALALGMGVFADDDENKDLYTLQASSYLLDRVANETSSSQLGILGEFYSKAKEPITGLTQLKDFFTFYKAFDLSEVERGSYKGLTHSQEYFIKNVPGFKQFRDFNSAENLKNARDKYDYFSGQEPFVMLNWFINEDDLK